MGRARLIAVLALVAVAGFLTTLDNTVINVALPTVQRELDLSVAGLEWVATAYVLSFGALLLAGGRLSDLLGRRAVLAAGMIVFTLASAACALAGSGTELVAARAVQGVGAALVIPACLAVVAADLPARRRALAMGLWTAALAIALASGPAVGGLVTEHFGWTWVFLLNVPFGILALALVPAVPAAPRRKKTPPEPEAPGGARHGLGHGRSHEAHTSAYGSLGGTGPPYGAHGAEGVPLPTYAPYGEAVEAAPAYGDAGGAKGHGRRSGGAGEPRESDRTGLRAALDLPGTVLSVAALSLLTWALIEGGEHSFTSTPVLAGLVLTLVLGFAFVRTEARSPAPLMDLRLLRDRALSGGALAQVLWGIGVNGVFFFTALYLQRILGLTPTEAGLAFVPLAGALLLTTPFAERAAALVGAHVSVAVGLALVAAGLFQLSFVGLGAGWLDLQPGLLLIGAGSALTTVLTVRSIEGVHVSRTGMASGFVSAAREISGVFGVVLVGAVLTRRERTALAAGDSPASAFLDGYHAGLRLAAVCVLLGAVVTFVSLRRRGRHRKARGAVPRRRSVPAGHGAGATGQYRPAGAGGNPAVQGAGGPPTVPRGGATGRTVEVTPRPRPAGPGAERGHRARV